MTRDAEPHTDPQRHEYKVELDRAVTRIPDHLTRTEIRLLDESFNKDPLRHFDWMRCEAPIDWDDASGIWGITRYEDVMPIRFATAGTSVVR